MTGHERMHLEWSWSHTPKTGHEQGNLRLVIRPRPHVMEITLEMSNLSVSKLDFLIFL